MAVSEFNEDGEYRTAYRDPATIPRCGACRHWTRGSDDPRWGICDAWGLRDKRHEETTCYRWDRRENK